jgi:pyruvate ferredoxin oxidoreductase alpha subunit
VQDVLDSVVISYRVAEEALLPVMINMDAFYLTHTSEVLDVPEQPEVDEFLSRSRPARVLDVNHPVTFGNVCGSDIYASLKFSRHLDSLSTALLWDRVANEFAQRFGRFHPPVESYRTGDAELIIVSIGTAAGASRGFTAFYGSSFSENPFHGGHPARETDRGY